MDGWIGWNSHLCLVPLLVGRTEAFRASSLTGRALTRRTRGTATRGRLTGTTRGTGDTLPRYSNNLKRERRGQGEGRQRGEREQEEKGWSRERKERYEEKVEKEENKGESWERKKKRGSRWELRRGERGWLKRRSWEGQRRSKIYIRFK